MKAKPLPNADEKFFFHMHNFDDEVIDEELLEEEEDLPPPPPTFSEAELAAAKKQAFADGHAAGKREVEESRSQALAEMMQKLAGDMHTLFAAEAAREALYERETVVLCHALFKQAFPMAHDNHGFDQLIHELEGVLRAQHGQRKIEIRVSPDYAQGVEAFMEKLKAQNSELDAIVTGDEMLADGAFKLGWADGGAIYDAYATAQRILGNLEETLASAGTTSHDGSSIDSQESGEIMPEHDTGDNADAGDNPSVGPIAEDDNE